MKITKVMPLPPPSTVKIECTKDEAMVLYAALTDFINQHKQAAHREEWIKWAKELNNLVKL